MNETPKTSEAKTTQKPCYTITTDAGKETAVHYNKARQIFNASKGRAVLQQGFTILLSK